MLTRYKVIELVALNSLPSGVMITAMNLPGTIVGTYHMPIRAADEGFGRTGLRSFRLAKGRLHRLVGQETSDVSVNAINDAGTAVGSNASLAAMEEGAALLWKPHNDRAVPLGGGSAVGINDHDEIALNRYHFSDGQGYGGAYRLPANGTAIALQAPTSLSYRELLSVSGINSRGQMVGIIGEGILLLWEKGAQIAKPLEITRKASLQAVSGITSARINDRGTILGGLRMERSAPQSPHILFWRKGATQTVFAVDTGETQVATAITNVALNNRDACVIEVARYNVGAPSYTSYHWYRGVTERLPLSRVFAINDRGQIAGSIRTAQGREQFWLLTPY